MNVFDLAGKKPKIKPPSDLSEPALAPLEALYAEEDVSLEEFKRTRRAESPRRQRSKKVSKAQ